MVVELSSLRSHSGTETKSAHQQSRGVMDALRKVYHNSQSTDFKRRVREVKNTLYNYSDMEQLVREATCNDAREPSVMLMKEIAKGTFTVEFSSIMSIVWKRIKDKSSEHHPYKCLVLLEFLLREGNSDMVLPQIQNNLHLLQALTSFRLINDRSVDVGYQVRDRASKFLQSLDGAKATPGRAVGSHEDHSAGSDGGGQMGAEQARGAGFGSESFGGDGLGGGGFGGDSFGGDSFGGDSFGGGFGAGGGAAGDEQGDAWKSQVEWEDDDGPAGGASASGGKFQVKIRSTQDVLSPAAVAPVKLTLGSGATAASGRARPRAGRRRSRCP